MPLIFNPRRPVPRTALRLATLSCIALLAACAGAPPRNPLATWVPSPNYNIRQPVVIVIHFTDQHSAQESLDTLRSRNSGGPVSAHYLVGSDGHIYQLVADQLRAWHAGGGRWGTITDLNSASIGIELDNDGHSPFAAGADRQPAATADRPHHATGHSAHADHRPRGPGPGPQERSRPAVSVAATRRRRLRSLAARRADEPARRLRSVDGDGRGRLFAGRPRRGAALVPRSLPRQRSHRRSRSTRRICASSTTWCSRSRAAAASKRASVDCLAEIQHLIGIRFDQHAERLVVARAQHGAMLQQLVRYRQARRMLTAARPRPSPSRPAAATTATAPRASRGESAAAAPLCRTARRCGRAGRSWLRSRLLADTSCRPPTTHGRHNGAARAGTSPARWRRHARHRAFRGQRLVHAMHALRDDARRRGETMIGTPAFECQRGAGMAEQIRIQRLQHGQRLRAAQGRIRPALRVTGSRAPTTLQPSIETVPTHRASSRQQRRKRFIGTQSSGTRPETLKQTPRHTQASVGPSADHPAVPPCRRAPSVFA